MRQILIHGQSIIKRVDWIFLIGVAFLMALGLVMHYSIGLNQETPDLQQFYKQLTYVAIGIALFIILNIVDYRIFKTHPFFYAGAGIVLLIAVLLFGVELKGATGWFIIGPISIQPVELVKIAFILFLATYVEKNPHCFQDARYFFFVGGIAALFVGLTVLQPDTGSAFILFCIWFFYCLLLKTPKKFLALVIVVVAIVGTLGYSYLPDYQQQRLKTFMNPTEDPTGAGYNVTQSIVAVGSGSFWGRGLGLGTQSQLHFLPEVSSDFIFAVIAEELGFVGILGVLTAFILILFRLWVYMKTTKDTFGFLLILGIGIYLVVQTFLVIGMNIGLLPVTGLPLPLVSAGGSSMISICILLAIAHKIGVASRTD